MSNGAVIGTGIDLIENDRMEQVLSRWGEAFKRKVFLEGEQAYCNAKAFPCHHYAARFAVKEAVSKAFGTGMVAQLSWLDIEVTRNNATGAPSVALSERGQCLADAMGVGSILVSLSHTRNYAVAQALLLGGAAEGAS